jgi:hypothetical protein
MGSQEITSPLAFAKGLLFINILQILILRHYFNIEELSDLI